MDKDRDPQEEGTSGNGATVLDFKLEEFKALRSEISALMLENQTIERYAGAAVAGVVTWLLTTNGMAPPAKAAAWIVPLLISLLAALRSKGIGTRLGQIGDYIRDTEQHDFKVSGWETYLKGPERPESNGKGYLNKIANILHLEKLANNLRKAPFEWTARAYWGVLILITIVFFVVGFISSIWDSGGDSSDANVEIRLEQSSGTVGSQS